MDSILNITKFKLTDDQDESKSFSNTIVPNDLLYDTVFSFSTPASFLQLSRTSRAVHTAVKSYMYRAFRIDKVFSRFFSSPLAFRQIQARTGTLVSGSVALQFFSRSYYPEADIDIYVHMKFRLEVADFLFKDGYTFAPEQGQDADFQKASSDHYLKFADIYKYKEVITAFTFEKKNEDGKVMKAQLIIAAECPLQAILGFHSSQLIFIFSDF